MSDEVHNFRFEIRSKQAQALGPIIEKDVRSEAGCGSAVVVSTTTMHYAAIQIWKKVVKIPDVDRFGQRKDV